MAQVSTEIKGALVERGREVDLAMIALVSRQHLFLLGPPGTGKSLTARMVGKALGGEYFEILLTRFTEPSEVFGPISVKQLVESEKFERKIDRYLPSVKVGFLDEIWKASSAILNSLLTIVNEREYDNGGTRVSVPLQTLFTASNELPGDASLAALYDRFLLRHEVLPVSNPLQLLDDRPQPRSRLVHLDALQQAANGVDLPMPLRQAMWDLKNALAARSVVVGDRRFKQSAALIRAAALTSGRSTAAPEDLWPLAFSWWETPDQIPTLESAVDSAILAAANGQAAPRPAAPPPAPPPRRNNPPPPTPPVPRSANQPQTPQDKWNAVLSRIRAGTPDTNAVDTDLHIWIEELIRMNYGSPRENQQLVDWKASITRASKGRPWLGNKTTP